MKVHMKRYFVSSPTGQRFATYIRVELSPEERFAVGQAKLRSCRIQTHGNVISKAFEIQMNRIRNRWSVGIARSTGFVFFDLLALAFGAFLLLVKQAFRVFIGTRARFSDLLEGAEFLSRSIEEQKETEAFVFASLSAVDKAIEFVNEFGHEEFLENRDYQREVPGLTFAGGLALGAAGPTVPKPVESDARTPEETEETEEDEYADEVDDEFDEDADVEVTA